MKRIFIIQALIFILFSLQPAYSDWSPDPEFGWQPRLYTDGFYQNGRSVCIGIAIADDANPDLSFNYTVGRNEVGVTQGVDLLEDYFFNIDDAIASVEINYPDKDGNSKSTVYLFAVYDFCLNDNDAEYKYGLIKGDSFGNVGESIDKANFLYTKSGEDCIEETVEPCADMDLTTFYGWADKTKEEWGWEEDNDEDDDDDNDTPSDEKDDDDDDDGCGCMISGQRSGLTTFLVMFLIGCLFLLFRKREIK